jgi:hypothetical protein
LSPIYCSSFSHEIVILLYFRETMHRNFRLTVGPKKFMGLLCIQFEILTLYI